MKYFNNKFKNATINAIIVLAVMLVGFVLQMLVGFFDYSWMEYPTNAYCFFLFILSIAIGRVFQKSWLVQRLTELSFCVYILFFLVVFCLVLGIMPQSNIHETEILHGSVWLGLTDITASWPFVLLYALTTLSLGLLLIKGTWLRSAKSIGVNCNHLGLFIILTFAGLGAADLERHELILRKGELSWRIASTPDIAKELPVRVEVINITVNEYPPEIFIIDLTNGRQIQDKFFYLEPDGSNVGRIKFWDISVITYYEHSKVSSNAFVYSDDLSRSPAAYIVATHIDSGEKKSGWLGWRPESRQTILLDEKHELKLSRPILKWAQADVVMEVYGQGTVKGKIAVNSPLVAGHWTLYQYDYDKSSDTLWLELVKDRWLSPVYLGILVMMFGATMLILNGVGQGAKK